MVLDPFGSVMDECTPLPWILFSYHPYLASVTCFYHFSSYVPSQNFRRNQITLPYTRFTVLSIKSSRRVRVTFDWRLVVSWFYLPSTANKGLCGLVGVLAREDRSLYRWPKSKVPGWRWSTNKTPKFELSRFWLDKVKVYLPSKGRQKTKTKGAWTTVSIRRWMC